MSPRRPKASALPAGRLFATVQPGLPAVQETSVAVPVMAAPSLALAIAVIVAWPGPVATAMPVEPTVAMFRSLETHFTCPVTS